MNWLIRNRGTAEWMIDLDSRFMRVITLRLDNTAKRLPMVFVLVKLAVQFAKQHHVKENDLHDLLAQVWDTCDENGHVSGQWTEGKAV